MLLDKEKKKIIEDIMEHPYHRFIGFTIDSIKDGSADISIEVAGNKLNTAGFLHGGILTSVIDIASFIACLSISPKNQLPVTINSHVNIIRSVSKGTLKIKATVIKLGRINCVIDSNVVSEAGQVIAIAHFTKALIPLEKLGEMKGK